MIHPISPMPTKRRNGTFLRNLYIRFAKIPIRLFLKCLQDIKKESQEGELKYTNIYI